MQGFATRWVTPCNLKIPHQRRDETAITTVKKRAEGAEWYQLVRCHVDEEEGMTRGRDVIRTATVRNGDINQRDASGTLQVWWCHLHRGALETHDAFRIADARRQHPINYSAYACLLLWL